MQHHYFDHNASTPVAPTVLRDLTATLVDVCGNASSIHHFGQAAKQRLERARREVAARIGCDAREIVFTSGGTESDNLAIFGIAKRSARNARHIITSAIEHPAVWNACSQLEREGAEVTDLPVGSDGIVDPDDVKRALRPATALVTIMHANNETGAIQPVREIAALTKKAGAVFHCDGVQMGGRVPVNVRELGVDLYSVSGHKFSAPKGVGALYVRKGITLEAMLFGGHHERDRRAGTENVPGIAGFGAAAKASAAGLPVIAVQSASRDELAATVTSIDAVALGEGAPRLAQTLCFAAPGFAAELQVMGLDLAGVMASAGAACSSGKVKPSRVIEAMGRPDLAPFAIRVSGGWATTSADWARCGAAWSEIFDRHQARRRAKALA